MRRSAALIGLVLLGMLLTSACSDNDHGPDADLAWFVGLNAEATTTGGLPLTVRIGVTVSSQDPTLGRRPPDGTEVHFSTSGGTFANGSRETVATTVNGTAEATVTFTEPGDYTVTAEVEGDSAGVQIHITGT